MSKFFLRCRTCPAAFPGLSHWRETGGRCPRCRGAFADVVYRRPFGPLASDDGGRPGLWRYWERLPLTDPAGLVSAGEGRVPIERWPFLEAEAERRGVELTVYAHRHDLSPATGTFKDLSGAVIASAAREAGIGAMVVATTGNMGTALARYLAAAGIELHAFLPRAASPLQAAEIAAYGQRAWRVAGDYARAKQLAGDYAAAHGLYLAPGGYDPLRIEAKKTLLYEWRRQLPRLPTVYVQALSGGTGPLGILRACEEFALEPGFRPPRLLLVQSDRCAPMAEAWAAARRQGFPPGWEERYPVYQDPATAIPTLATGRPGLFPLLAPGVRAVGGEILAFPEAQAVAVARRVVRAVQVCPGPAAAIAVGGLLLALDRGLLRSGDVVLLAIGEGARRSPEFLAAVGGEATEVSTLADCRMPD